MVEWFEVNEIEEGIWCIGEPYHVENVNSYLILGDGKGLLIDTGLGISNIKNVVEQITPDPVEVVNTHSHYDHVGDNHRFDKIAIHKDEARQLERGRNPKTLQQFVEPQMFKKEPPKDFDPQTYSIEPSKAHRQLKDGDSLTVGNRTLRIVHTPGHSPGSICLWEESRGLLFTGDTIYDGPLYAQLPHSNFDDYIRSLSSLCSLVPKVNKVLPSHGRTPLDPMIILKIAKIFEQVSQGGVEYWFKESPWGRVRFYQLDGLSLYLR
jgi:glyoxylase-like metal-dependent hydrolase (beta-lactamase superfamily II)